MKSARIKRFYFIVFCFFIVLIAGALPGIFQAQDLRIAVVREGSGAAQNHQAILANLEKQGIKANLVEAPTYDAAAGMFSSGKVDAIFSGSGTAGSLLVTRRL